MHARTVVVRFALAIAIAAASSACSLTTSTDGLSETEAARVFPPTCSDRERDGHETDVDCGGGECGSCALGKECDESTDCASGLCQDGRCRAATCANRVRDGAETDVDCGGASCQPCPAKACWKDSDCASGDCSGFQCK